VKKFDGSKEQVQKRLVLGNLSELYVLFKEQNTEKKVSLSVFSKLRPRHCVLAGASGTHTVCVCVYHENVKLMLDAIDIEKLSSRSEYRIADYRDAITMIVCDSPNADCFLNLCLSCPGKDRLKSHLSAILEDNNIENIKYQVWQQTDRSTLRTEVSESEVFVEELCNRILALKPHSFIAKEQSVF